MGSTHSLCKEERGQHAAVCAHVDYMALNKMTVKTGTRCR